MKPLISVLVPVYNGEKYLVPCLESLLHQEFENYEVVVLDDGSTDKTAEIISLYEDNPKLRRLYKKNEKSIAKSRNFLLDHIQGEYFVFVDSDDVVSHLFLKLLYEAIQRDNCDISCCNYTLAKNFKNSEKIKKYKVCDRENALKEMIIGINGQYILWNKLIKTEFIRNKRCRDLSFGEDFCFIFEIMQNEAKVCFIDNQLYFYRFFVNRFSKEKLTKKKKDFLNEMIKMEKEEEYQRDSYLLSCWIYVTASSYLMSAINDKDYFNYLVEIMNERFDIYKKNKVKTVRKFIKIIFNF